MEAAMGEMPLAIFTTLAPIGAGAFITLAIAIWTRAFSAEEMRRIDKFTLIPLLVSLAGMAGAFLHLTAPLNALNVIRTVGSTPMANEIFSFGVFFVVAVVYWFLAMIGKLNPGLRKIGVGLTAILALVLALFTSLAYMLDTVPTWNNGFTPVSIFGFTLLGGTLLGYLVLKFAGVTEDFRHDEGGKKIRKATMVIYVIGFVLSVVGVVGLFYVGANAYSAVIDVSANAAEVLPLFVGAMVLIVVGGVLGFFCIKGHVGPVVTTIIVVLIVAGVFLARLTFYGMQIGIGM